MIALMPVGLSNRRAALGVFFGACSLLLHVGAVARQAPPVSGLDHVPIAVRDLEAATETYRRLGFALKPGRPHDNGIRNQHVKFPDGTELELITAPEARDPLTTTYREHLEAGDGPAFLALYAPDASRVPRNLDAPLGYLFFGPRNASPTDRPEHFAHPNSAQTLAAVWLADNDLEPERTLFAKLGGTIARRAVHVPDRVEADVARFGDGEVLLLPGARQRVAGRRIVGVTVRVRSLRTASELLKSRGIQASRRGDTASTSLFLAPETAHGLWIEFREQP
jgi:catechol 2,3-dioxygenase-like lactoylglutathione lyase family enzyme